MWPRAHFFCHTATCTAFVCAVLCLGESAWAQQRVQVNGFVNVTFAAWSGGGDLTSNQNLCTYVRNAPQNYYVTATSSHAQGALFRLRAGPNRNVAYNVGWREQPNGTYATSTAGGPGLPFAGSGIRSVLQHNASATQNCPAGRTATLSILVPSANLQTARTGTYTDTLTILMAPW
jgi:hypothetical protein